MPSDRKTLELFLFSLPSLPYSSSNFQSVFFKINFVIFYRRPCPVNMEHMCFVDFSDFFFLNCILHRKVRGILLTDSIIFDRREKKTTEK